MYSIQQCTRYTVEPHNGGVMNAGEHEGALEVSTGVLYAVTAAQLRAVLPAGAVFVREG